MTKNIIEKLKAELRSQGRWQKMSLRELCFLSIQSVNFITHLTPRHTLGTKSVCAKTA